MLSDDVFPDETTMIVKKRFHGGEAVYTFGATKIAGSWWVTGTQAGGKPMTWDRFLIWLSAGIVVSAKVAADFSKELVRA